MAWKRTAWTGPNGETGHGCWIEEEFFTTTEAMCRRWDVRFPGWKHVIEIQDEEPESKAARGWGRHPLSAREEAGLAPAGWELTPGDVLTLPDDHADVEAGMYVLLWLSSAEAGLCRAVESETGDIDTSNALVTVFIEELERFERTGLALKALRDMPE